MNWATSRLSTWIGGSFTSLITNPFWMATSSLKFHAEIPKTEQAVRIAPSRLVLTRHGIAGNNIPFLCSTPKGRTKKIEVKCYGNILGSYREHPEAKFLGSDGEPCNKLTRGLLRRSEIVANQHRYIGKETSRKWEQGDDPSLVDFHCAEYSDGKTTADEELRKQIAGFGIRKTARATNTDSKTIMLIVRRERVKPSTLAKLREFFRTGENGEHAL